MNNEWIPVKFAHDCVECKTCGEPWCKEHQLHYADCPCPGPHQEDEFEYKTIDKKLFARER